MNRFDAVIFDWAGTTVDYGCFAPVEAFISAFEGVGIRPTVEETRAPMGLPKRDHVAAMLAVPRIAGEFKALTGRMPCAADVDAIYAAFEPALFKVLAGYAEPLPGVLGTVVALRAQGVKLGSTTGYTSAMMDVVAPLARQKGFSPDCLVCPDDVEGRGRPHPDMIHRNMQLLGLSDPARIVKVGDTVADIQEGVAAGCVSVGVLIGSSMLGLSQAETAAMSAGALALCKQQAATAYRDAGADAVLDSITDLSAFMESHPERRETA